jgi:IS30 family transposase
MPGLRLTLEERVRIEVLWSAGESIPRIAELVGRHRSTVHREVTRNGSGRHGLKHPGRVGSASRGVLRGPYRWGYRADWAQEHARVRARRPKQGRLRPESALRAFVVDGLRQQWSPQEISGRLEKAYPCSPEMRVSHETIYQAFYVQSRGALREMLGREVLRRGRAQRIPRRPDGVCGKGKRRLDLLRISARPAEADNRSLPGHWEGDLIMGARQASAIGVLVERTTRFVVLVALPDKAWHDSERFADLAAAQISALPEHLRRSMAWDRGFEMVHAHVEFEKKAGLTVYFCDPHSPWQRGTNENTNGLLRQYFPKGTSLTSYSQDDLDAIADRLNGRPRKTLDWETPSEALNKYLVATAA